ncbi:MAG: hypothetical protein OXT65_02895, partial [Alphaproteobacteria bacterium]|nr:hypothetical protein [Alphaproteobacteria bacterium]
MRYIIFFFTALLATTPTPAKADTLQLQNGDSLSGRVLHGGRTHQLYFQTAYGTLFIPWQDVRQITDNNGSPIATATAQTTHRTFT